MRVLQINSVCGVGSTGRITTDLYKVLVENGHECLIAYGRGNAPIGINSYRIGTNFDNYLHAMKTRLLDLHGFGSKSATINFIEKIKEFNPDVIHLHNIHGYYINMEVLFNFLKEYDKPVIWTLHDCWSFTGHCSHFEYEKCDKWKTKCYNCGFCNKYPKSYFNFNVEKNFKKKKNIFCGIKNMTIVTPSNWLKKQVSDSFLKNYSVDVINNGVDTSIYCPRKSNIKAYYGLDKYRIVLGVANEWNGRKGVKIFNNLSEKLDPKFKIVVVGVRKKNRGLFNKNILTLSHTSNPIELAELYSAADVFFNPTLEDTYPTTNLEAIACATHVITFDTGGCSETINGYSGGKLIEKKYQDNYGYIISQIYNCIEKELNEDYSKYDKNESLKKYIRKYEEILK